MLEAFAETMKTMDWVVQGWQRRLGRSQEPSPFQALGLERDSADQIESGPKGTQKPKKEEKKQGKGQK